MKYCRIILSTENNRWEKYLTFVGGGDKIGERGVSQSTPASPGLSSWRQLLLFQNAEGSPARVPGLSVHSPLFSGWWCLQHLTDCKVLPRSGGMTRGKGTWPQDGDTAMAQKHQNSNKGTILAENTDIKLVALGHWQFNKLVQFWIFW